MINDQTNMSDRLCMNEQQHNSKGSDHSCSLHNANLEPFVRFTATLWDIQCWDANC